MESRDLFNTSKRLLYKVDWENEYFHIGQPPTINMKSFLKTISNYFESKKIHLILDRQNSRSIPIIDLEQCLTSLDFNYLLWEENFSFVIEYNSIGVFRKGRVKNEE
ncbi:hypothetical protein MY04_2102 [Flammeovirga sp. MY04]|uniref:hypothetical protein n=1 Tax=Flammeovirga sp. MY04 TaxID=1191459 RepID=UPI00080611D8|nr:hypothetical protein [Flammeovirga sp. MY04]ANQ49476.1 hypothetical protein MY04_2102 [Flammeovirga sp. MY04]